ncbi:hypothetical protein HWV62_43708 [Athelia sp. TMB]|nr:hypothetical protein HWV62_43708 [Athelia sp. TMB]
MIGEQEPRRWGRLAVSVISQLRDQTFKSALALHVTDIAMLPTLLLPQLRRSFHSSAIHLSGHNKWSKIKGKKAILDAQKSQIYGKARRSEKDILVAARSGGSTDPDKNITLAAALKAARAAGVPKDNIDRAMNKAGGGKGQGSLPVTYEALAKGSVGIIIKGYVKVGLDRGEDFDDRLETLIETAFEANAEDFEEVESAEASAEFEFTCPPTNLATLAAAIDAPVSRGVLSSELIYTPLQASEPPDEELAQKIGDLVGELEEDEDTLRVWTTLDS